MNVDDRLRRAIGAAETFFADEAVPSFRPPRQSRRATGTAVALTAVAATMLVARWLVPGVTPETMMTGLVPKPSLSDTPSTSTVTTNPAKCAEQFPFFQADNFDSLEGTVAPDGSRLWSTTYAEVIVRSGDATPGSQIEPVALPRIEATALVWETSWGRQAEIRFASGPCAGLVIDVRSEVRDAAADTMQAFLEGLRPIDTLAAFLAEIEAANQPVTCPAGPPAPLGAGETYIYVSCVRDGPPYPVARPVSAGVDPLPEALKALIDGPTRSEFDLGMTGPFDFLDQSTKMRLVPVVDRGGDGSLSVGFELDGDKWMPGPAVSTSSQIGTFLDPLLATLFGFDEVEMVVLSTCVSEVGCGLVTSRAEWQTAMTANFGVKPECGLEGFWSEPPCRS